ncbi:hypothetical protein NDU88_004567 [Pleurodeles waltl]|uniref:Uncharacterized protein n=1 Tax=Pleurodeles waltl TaxID=8319 RepID=A0AAV7MVI7_PLEWA|nr:hypothetical protein NDU88_004567 [Pleurodeles waltl]
MDAVTVGPPRRHSIPKSGLRAAGAAVACTAPLCFNPDAGEVRIPRRGFTRMRFQCFRFRLNKRCSIDYRPPIGPSMSLAAPQALVVRFRTLSPQAQIQGCGWINGSGSL